MVRVVRVVMASRGAGMSTFCDANLTSFFVPRGDNRRKIALNGFLDKVENQTHHQRHLDSSTLQINTNSTNSTNSKEPQSPKKLPTRHNHHHQPLPTPPLPPKNNIQLSLSSPSPPSITTTNNPHPVPECNPNPLLPHNLCTQSIPTSPHSAAINQSINQSIHPFHHHSTEPTHPLSRTTYYVASDYPGPRIRSTQPSCCHSRFFTLAFFSLTSPLLARSPCKNK